MAILLNPVTVDELYIFLRIKFHFSFLLKLNLTISCVFLRCNRFFGKKIKMQSFMRRLIIASTISFIGSALVSSAVRSYVLYKNVPDLNPPVPFVKWPTPVVKYYFNSNFPFPDTTYNDRVRDAVKPWNLLSDGALIYTESTTPDSSQVGSGSVNFEI